MAEPYLRAFVFYTIFSALVHFSLETWFTVRFGQSWLGLLPDYISVALMLFGSTLVLKDQRYQGLLCGAWGFAFCLNYRAWAWRLERNLEGDSSALIDNTMYVLSLTLVLALISFVISMIYAYRAARSE